MDILKLMIPDRTSIIFIGHASSGKSMTAGRFVCKCSCQNLEALNIKTEEIERTAMFYPAIMEMLNKERASDIIIKTPNRIVSIIDGPDHQNIIQNQIKGHSKIDAALIYIDASKYNPGRGISEIDQLGNDIILSHTSGINRFVFVVNKMDHESVAFSEERFNEIRHEIDHFIAPLGIKEELISFIPISAFNDDNIFERSANISWWNGKTLIEEIDGIPSPHPLIEMPLRFVIKDIYKLSNVGFVYAGRVESGVLRPGMSVAFAPSGQVAIVRDLEMRHGGMQEGVPGDITAFSVIGEPPSEIEPGYVVCSPTDCLLRETKSFVAQILVSNEAVIENGSQATLESHNIQVSCTIDHIIKRIDHVHEFKLIDNPESLQGGDFGVVRIVPSKPIVVEPFSKLHTLGSIVIRNDTKAISAGVVCSVESK